MVLRRITTSLRHVSGSVRDQNWTAVVIEFVLVIAGVFLGILAANWNQERLEKRKTEQLLLQIDDQLTAFVVYLDSLDDYYASAGRYGDRAIAGWQGDPLVSDEEFVIAAYQASQIVGVDNSGDVWGAILGAENLRDIDDTALRQNLAAILTFDRELVDLRSVATRYREEVRKTIPHDIQSAIRAKCNDRFADGRLTLPVRCDIDIQSESAAAAAAALRARPDLVAELRWHRAAVANQVTQAEVLEQLSRTLTQQLGEPAAEESS